PPQRFDPLDPSWATYSAQIDGSRRTALLFRDAAINPTISPPVLQTGTRYRAMYLNSNNQMQTSLTTLRAGGTTKNDVSYIMIDLNGDGLADAYEFPVTAPLGGPLSISANNVYPNTGAGFVVSTAAMDSTLVTDPNYMFNDYQSPPAAGVADFNQD